MYLTDLKIIDELLLDYKDEAHLTWKELESYSNLTSYAMNRLREAWKNNEMESITLSLANYFRDNG